VSEIGLAIRVTAYVRDIKVGCGFSDGTGASQRGIFCESTGSVVDPREQRSMRGVQVFRVVY
jgi:hypothetical protein